MTPEEYVEIYSSHLGPNNDYFETHKKRFLQTLCNLPKATQGGMRAIEVGTYGFFLKAMKDIAGYDRVDGAIFESDTPYKIIQRSYSFDTDQTKFTLYNGNIEQECLPMDGEEYDLIIAPEIIEHMPLDPVGFMGELNRVMKFGGRLFLTTPNVSSIENIHRILWRQVPNSYYHYRSARISDRHNLEYGPDLMMQLMENCGFSVERIWTEYSWFPPRDDLLDWVGKAGYPTELRGDNLFVQAVKTGHVKERFPNFLYD
ncbi:bifunctional 2-polyprenyl-6-hydroxyphenol methylase/3-demethylubiquinol 3-O-methyltransferase UbiG [Brevundimonas sp. 'scallop']|uniref:class I SAM-dependent methyltransferase n=1 Tax=Brevundimonas sp. 'scallop' TaxID=2562582 RepID=UPI0013E2041C|nr:methyltransferase domain-containing protein [Brevundimonas sp. 'scallop']QIF80619.1 class I SAM-dependent methyltransferase [Brevundimonas sp. 'scallop']